MATQNNDLNEENINRVTTRKGQSSVGLNIRRITTGNYTILRAGLTVILTEEHSIG